MRDNPPKPATPPTTAPPVQTEGTKDKIKQLKDAGLTDEQIKKLLDKGAK
jgi:hypothetical protein